ncbi:hypothetical protein M408DRAFT_332263 [Serendipita vermifera MAFF 305830]|uniref:Required for respiratory growth protein 9, mitochondrial n=1 Tax=Serendipita vermifera MAFF 305830 TaxID=933852 RepID=A0A0C3AWQ6_SERVB|nr:hypothetical protein M408DRAFT_332263 [Serendipita vermifera MAFF 305830]
MKPSAFQLLPHELKRSIISLQFQSFIRCYATTQRLVLTRNRDASKRQVEAPSPLSPISKFSSRDMKASQRPASTHGSKTKNPGASDEKAPLPKKKNKNSREPRAKASKNVAGTSPTRKLLVTPALDRVSRVPVWARPPTVTAEKEMQPPGGATSWGERRAMVKERYPERWNPSKKVSREAMEAIRELHRQDPEKYPSWVLAQRFTISPEAVRRILKSNWKMSEERLEEKVMKQRKRRIERVKRAQEDEMHQLVRAGIQLKVHPEDELRLK